VKKSALLALLLGMMVACDGSGPVESDLVLFGINPVAPSGSCFVKDQSFDGNVAIPRDATCTFVNVLIEGNLKMNRGARLLANQIDVNGDIQGERAAELVVDDSRILGNIQFERGGRVEVWQSFVDGDIQLGSNDGDLTVTDTTIEGNLQLFRNRGGPFTLTANRVDGNLQCKENAPHPAGSGNVVQGNREDQCSGR